MNNHEHSESLIYHINGLLGKRNLAVKLFFSLPNQVNITLCQLVATTLAKTIN